MKRDTIAVGMSLTTLVLVGIAWAGQSAGAQSREVRDTEKRTIQTTGTGTVRVRPDHARVFFGVQTFAPTVKQARGQNAAQTKQVTTALTALKIPDLKMKSSNITVELVQTDPDGRAPKIVGYRITNTFTVLIHQDNADQLGPLASRIMDSALENGANQVQQIVFFREDQKEAKREALMKAVEDARGNAEAMAAGARKKIVDVTAINGQPQFEVFDQRMTNSIQAAVPEGDSTTLMAGELDVTCTVNATYSY
jgi:uncharacterized protein YggE